MVSRFDNALKSSCPPIQSSLFFIRREVIHFTSGDCIKNRENPASNADRWLACVGQLIS